MKSIFGKLILLCFLAISFSNFAQADPADSDCLLADDSGRGEGKQPGDLPPEPPETPETPEAEIE